jgi:2',3'-cyclic-nucleotide 2'-phosphodiesterase/3'-nucleotidase
VLRFWLVLFPALAALAETRTIRVLQTTDLHGYIYPYDYFAARPANRGLAKVATLIQAARTEKPDSLLIDCGDTIQGSPLEAVHQTRVRAGQSKAIDPMIAVMNALRYDAMVVGNHEFNYGLGNLNAARRASRFPWLSANTAGRSGFAPSIVKTVAGVRIGIVGLTTGGIPSWERPEHYRGLSWQDQVAAAQREVARLKADVVILAVHGGLDRDPATGRAFPGPLANDNMVWQLATALPKVDVILYGHTHRADAGTRIGGVLIVQARNWGQSLAQVDLTVEREATGAWKVRDKRSKLIPVTEQTTADAEVMKIAAPYHEATEAYLKTPVAESAAELDGRYGRYEDTALVDAIHEVQLHFTKADVSLTALFQPSLRIRKGPVTVREMASLYVFDNELYMVEGNGRMLKQALENAARFFKSCGDEACGGALLDPAFPGFNFDMAQGVGYEIDLTRPAGERVKNVTFQGKPLADDQPLKIALNSYRAAGSGGYEMFRDAKIAYRSGREIRDLLIEYYTEKKRLPEAADQNWRIVPPQALESLRRQQEPQR